MEMITFLFDEIHLQREITKFLPQLQHAKKKSNKFKLNKNANSRQIIIFVALINSTEHCIIFASIINVLFPLYKSSEHNDRHSPSRKKKSHSYDDKPENIH